MVKKVFFILVFGGLINWSWIGYDIFQAQEGKEQDKRKIENAIEWHWENRFTREEVTKVKSWLTQVYVHSQNTLGIYSFKIHFYIHRSKSGNEPVPWANTTRGETQGVHFHVNMSFDKQDFLDDWTAPHEISHLSIPFVGKTNMWFSEGYATYMQVQILQSQKVYSKLEANEKYHSQFLNCKADFQSNSPLTELVQELKAEWNYPAIYWGGASFFWKLNRELFTKKGISLLEVVKKYEQCCRVDESTQQEICEQFDEISHSSIATDLLLEYQTQPAKLVFEEFRD